MQNINPVYSWPAKVALWLLPREEHTPWAFLGGLGVLAALLFSTHRYVQAHGQAVSPLSIALVGGLALSAFVLFVLSMLVGFRFIIGIRARNPQLRNTLSVFWIALLWPYRKRDIEQADADGRLAELMIATMLLIMIVGLTIAVAMPH